MPETKPKKNKAWIIGIAAAVVVAILAVAIVLITRSGGAETGPEDPNGNPLYPKASAVTEVEYLHRGGLNSESGIAIDEKELTEDAYIEDFLEQLKAVTLREPTEEDRTSLDYTTDVEMFTLKRKDAEDTILIMDDSITINNEYGNYFYMTEDIDLETLTEHFTAIDYSDKLVSTSESE